MPNRNFSGWRHAALLMLSFASAAWADAPESVGPPTPDPPRWIDRTHDYLYNSLWRSAMAVDRAAGSGEPADVYQQLYGSITPALLWDEFRGFQPKLRFRVNFPLPQLNDRFHAVLGRVNPDEFITERAQESGAIQRQFGPASQDETLFGLSYHAPVKDDGGFGLGAGVRIRTPLDPYVKADYTITRGAPIDLQVTTRQTLFWEQSDHLGVTSRVDVNHFLSEVTLVQCSAAGTLSQKSQGLRGFAALTVLRSLALRRALVGNLALDFETRAPVSLHEFGGAVAYRQRLYRDWLILELRSSLTWPKETPGAPRTRSFGLGIGVEMLLGTTQFQARPATF